MPSTREMVPSRARMKKRSEAPRRIPASFWKEPGLKIIGVSTAPMARTKPILAIFDPTIVPMASVVLLITAAYTAEASSGKEVPRATMVKPITNSEIPKRRATRAASSTKRSDPLISNVREIKKMRKVSKSIKNACKRRLFNPFFLTKRHKDATRKFIYHIMTNKVYYN